MYNITVVVTTYNLENYIENCLDELYNQTYQNFDILIVDDASTDRTREIIEKKKLQWKSRLKVLYLEQNLGMPALTRNVALQSNLIDGQFTIFLDGDDSIEADMLESLFDLASDDVDVVICAFDRIDISNGKIIATEMKGLPSKVVMPTENDLLAFINTSPWNKMWRTEVIKNLRYPAFKVGEEVSFNFRGYAQCRSMAFTDKVLIHYRVRMGSIISNTDEQTIWKFADELSRLYKEMGGEYKDSIALIVFLHIGLSMGLRAADNPEIILKNHIKRTREYFKNDFNWFKNSNKYLKLNSLIKRGIKGIAIWIVFYSYKFGLFGLMISVYRRLNLNIKF